MNALVVYESYWGNTAEIARAIAEGFGPGARALPTDEVDPVVLTKADLVVVGAPVIAFHLAGDRMRESIRDGAAKAPRPPEIREPSMEAWLAGLPPLRARSATFETAIRWSPGGATGAIGRGLAAAGCRALTGSRRFVVTGQYGPLRTGEVDLARNWGAELRRAIERLGGIAA